MTTFRVLSDLHIESYEDGQYSGDELQIPPQKEGVLVLAGDIYPACRRERFARVLERLAGKAELVLFVPGNHEYYCEDRHVPMRMLQESMESTIREVAPSRIKYLDGQEVDVLRTRFVGATLWTEIPPSLHAMAQDYMNDYSRIWLTSRQNVTPADLSELHDRDRTLLAFRVRQAYEQRVENVVVVTHHAPDAALKTKTKRMTENAGIIRCYYNTDMRGVIYSPVVAAWCCGHDHVTRFEQLSPTSPVFISNAGGYAAMRNKQFNPKGVYRVVH